MLVVAVSAIAFLGFCIGKPLLDYIGSVGSEKSEPWTPEASYTALHDSPDESADEDHDVSAAVSDSPQNDSGSSAGTTVVTSDSKPVSTNQPHSTNTQSGTETSVPASADTLVCMEVPSGALSNRAALSAALAKARAGGYNAVVIQLKDRNGLLHYSSSIDGVTGSPVETGTMTLDEIMSVFRENSIVPVAEISVLSDDKGCEIFPEMSYKCIDSPATSWLEWVEKRRWSNPESDATREYFAEITAELSIAGFDNILLTDVAFPVFQHYDSAYIAQKYFAQDRYKLLYNVIKAGNIIEMKASDVIGESFGRTAEPLNDISQLRDNTIALVISRNDLPTSAGYPADAKTLVETTLSLAQKKAGGLEVIPLIDGSGFDDAEKAKIAGALSSLGYDSYIMR